MNEVYSVVDKSLGEIDCLLKLIKKNKSRQIESREEKLVIKASALAWFKNCLPLIVNSIDEGQIAKTNEIYKQILELSERRISRSKYVELFKTVREELIGIRNFVLTFKTSTQKSTDSPPQFDPLISDYKMQEILKNRWNECCNCLAGNAPLASIVMMGGLLEALLLARINKEQDKSAIFKTKAAPIDRRSGKVLILQEWTLRNYIDVAHELKWISQSAKDVGEVLRDYRNYIHPYKEFSHGISVSLDDANILWEITKSIMRQIIRLIV